MPEVPARAKLRFDSGGWRRFAELGCVYGPEWWKRLSPPLIAGVIFTIAARQRATVMRNQRQVRGPRPWLRERWDAYTVFAQMARSITESMEQWGPRPRPLEMTAPRGELVERAVAEGRGLIMLTGHFGSWEVGASMLKTLDRPVNWVMGTEPNPTVREFVHEMRTRHGFKVLYSDRSVLSGLPALQALRRGEIVCMQLDPWRGHRGTHAVSFCGERTRFQLGPFVLSRLAKAPVVPAFCVRKGIRRYEFRIPGRYDPRTPLECEQALEEVVAAYEALVREIPDQWIMFEDVWRDGEEAMPRYEMVPQASGLRRR